MKSAHAVAAVNDFIENNNCDEQTSADLEVNIELDNITLKFSHDLTHAYWVDWLVEY